MQTDFKRDWLERAFRLAYFITEDRETAKRVATESIAKLEVASNAQFKRYYYTPTGRTDSARAVRSRVTVNDLQLLQRLVFAETEVYERELEASKKASRRRMLVHFVKHLVRITLKRNSFYVTLAVTRILHNYGTSEALGLYSVVVQDPERVPDDYYCRSRKGLLMKELKSRFDGLLETVKAARGEERFDGGAAGPELERAARVSLAEFTPWNSNCAVPERFDPFTEVIKSFHFDRRDPDDEHRIEVGRIHAVLHPDCFGRLTVALKMSPSAEKLEIPMFMTNDERRDDDFDQRGPRGLDDDEFDAIARELTVREERRRAMTAGMLRVVADGAEVARFDSASASTAAFVLDEAAEIVEISALENGAETLLATHLMTRDDFAGGNLRRRLELPNGRVLTLDFAPQRDEFGEIVAFESVAEVGGGSVWSAVGEFWTKLSARRLLVPAAVFGGLLIALAIGFAIFGARESRPDFAALPSPPKSATPSAEPSTAPSVVPSVAPTTTPIDRRTVPAVKPTPRPRLTVVPKVNAVRPSENDIARDDMPRTDDAGILRLPIYERGGDERSATRGSQTARRASLGAVRTVFIDITGDRVIGGVIRERLADELERTGRFRVAANRESADAALKVFVRHEADGDEPEDRSATLIVRLVGADGFVVYPSQRRVSGWKYVGVAVRLAPRIVADLNRAAERGR